MIARVLLAACLLCAPGWAAEEGQQVELIREVLRHPQIEWSTLFEAQASLLDASFFQRIDQRIRWSAENNQVDDAIRFSMLADAAYQAIGRSGEYRMALCQFFRKSGNDELARQLLENVLLTEPGNCQARWSRAAYRLSERDTAGALADYDFLLAEGYQVAACHFQKAQVFLLMEREREARAELQASLAADPSFEAAHLALEKMQPAVTPGLFQQIPPLVDRVHAGPDPGVVAFERAEADFGAGRWQQAEANYLLALKHRPGQGKFWVQLGVLHYRLGDPARAAQEILKGLDISSDSADAWTYLGCCYERLYDREGKAAQLQAATQSFERVLQFRPQDPLALMALERLHSKKP